MASNTIAIDLRPVAQALQLSLRHVESVVELLDAGNTVPFITRYRKDQTGGLDEEQIRGIESRLTKMRLLAERKQTILRSIESQGKLTGELAAEIEAAASTKRLEDLYLPYKPKKQTLATVARERGLEPLADEVLAAAAACADLDARAADFVNSDKGVTSAADALLGVGHILAEHISERADLRQRLRQILKRTGKLMCTRGEGDEKLAQGFRDYFEFSDLLDRIPEHRVLAINRGEKAKALRVKVDADLEAMQAAVDEMVCEAEHPHVEFLRGCGRDALARLVFPSLEREVRRELTDWAEAHAVEVFARNLRNLLLQKPVRGRRVLAIDPGFKSGCKLAALDEFGNLLDQAVIHLVGKPERKQQGREKLAEMINTHQLSLVAIGNGTACRESEELISELLAAELADRGIAYVIVNEAGASVYSTSPLGREEFPEYDATLRGAISIGRRLQDPLSELVKIDPASIGVGMYQHDVKAKHLRTSLDAVVESCVNYVGVDLNTASPALLRYVSGLNQLTARRLYDYRTQNGPFSSREQLKEVPGFGESAFVQAAGFLKIGGGENPLDATWIHPESYELAGQVLEKLECTLADLAEKERAAAHRRTGRPNPARHAHRAVRRRCAVAPRHPRATQPAGTGPARGFPTPIFKKGVIKLDDLAPGMELQGTVLNVVDFGAFVDIGLHDTGLVHISQLANKYVRDPHEVVSVGDIVKVWVHEIDKTRRRVSLTMIEPGTERTPPKREKRKGDRRGRGSQGPPPAQSAGEATAGQDAAAGGEATAVTPAPTSTVQRQPGPPRRRHERREGRPRDGRAGKRPPSARPKPKFKSRSAGHRKSAPLVPLTNEMKAGKAPLRTFGDLKQFLELKKQPEDDSAQQNVAPADGAENDADAEKSPDAET